MNKNTCLSTNPGLPKKSGKQQHALCSNDGVQMDQCFSPLASFFEGPHMSPAHLGLGIAAIATAPPSESRRPWWKCVSCRCSIRRDAFLSQETRTVPFTFTSTVVWLTGWLAVSSHVSTDRFTFNWTAGGSLQLAGWLALFTGCRLALFH